MRGGTRIITKFISAAAAAVVMANVVEDAAGAGGISIFKFRNGDDPSARELRSSLSEFALLQRGDNDEGRV